MLEKFNSLYYFVEIDIIFILILIKIYLELKNGARNLKFYILLRVLTVTKPIDNVIIQVYMTTSEDKEDEAEIYK